MLVDNLEGPLLANLDSGVEDALLNDLLAAVFLSSVISPSLFRAVCILAVQFKQGCSKLPNVIETKPLRRKARAALLYPAPCPPIRQSAPFCAL